MDVQKKTLAAAERDEHKRRDFWERMRGVDPKRLVFVDESSTNTTFTPRYARAPKGERARGKAPRNWDKNVTLISSITLLEGMGASMSIQGSSDTESFGLHMREILAPTLMAGQIVIMDNLSVHRSSWVRELIEAEGCRRLKMTINGNAHLITVPSRRYARSRNADKDLLALPG